MCHIHPTVHRYSSIETAPLCKIKIICFSQNIPGVLKLKLIKNVVKTFDELFFNHFCIYLCSLPMIISLRALVLSKWRSNLFPERTNKMSSILFVTVIYIKITLKTLLNYYDLFSHVKSTQKYSY